MVDRRNTFRALVHSLSGVDEVSTNSLKMPLLTSARAYSLESLDIDLVEAAVLGLLFKGRTIDNNKKHAEDQMTRTYSVLRVFFGYLFKNKLLNQIRHSN